MNRKQTADQAEIDFVFEELTGHPAQGWDPDEAQRRLDLWDSIFMRAVIALGVLLASIAVIRLAGVEFRWP